jgi:hypothetical protein
MTVKTLAWAAFFAILNSRKNLVEGDKVTDTNGNAIPSVGNNPFPSYLGNTIHQFHYNRPDLPTVVVRYRREFRRPPLFISLLPPSPPPAASQPSPVDSATPLEQYLSAQRSSLVEQSGNIFVLPTAQVPTYVPSTMKDGRLHINHANRESMP